MHLPNPPQPTQNFQKAFSPLNHFTLWTEEYEKSVRVNVGN